MTLYALGLNHDTAPVQVRESFALKEQETRDFYRQLSLSPEGEVVLVSTCNRTEAYLFGTPEDVKAVRKALVVRAGESWPGDGSFCYQDEEAIRHVIEVSSGLRSQVLGDAQILAQVKDAYRLAVEEDRVHSYMHRLMHVTFRTAKRVMNETALADGIVSVSGAAIAAARLHFEQDGLQLFEDQRMLVLGAGEMAALALEALRSHGATDIRITNRTEANARQLAKKHGARTISWEERHAAIAASDLVIVATGAPRPTVVADELPHPTPASASRLMIDIAVPRNVEEQVGALPGYRVIDLDAIDERLAHVEARRKAELPAAREICEDGLQEYVTWIFHQQALQPAINAIRNTFDSIRRQEIERHAHRFAETDADELDHLTRSILQKLLAIPVVRLKNVDPDSIDYVHGIRLLEALFSKSSRETDGESVDPRVAARKPSSMHPPSACPFGSDEMQADQSPEQKLAEMFRQFAAEKEQE